MKEIFSLFFLLILFTTAQSQKNPHKNITIGTSNEPNEPTIAIHRKNPDILLGGANIYNLYLSNDSGLTWEEKTLESTYGVWGDPVIIADTAGNFYFFHLSNPPNGNWIDRIVCQKTEDNGKTWTNGSYIGLNGKKAQDKPWAVVDPQTNYIYLTWTQFDAYGSTNPKDKSSILFSMSKDEGETWTAAKKINEVDGDCVDSDNTTEGAVPAIGPNGELYVVWAVAEKLVFNRSFDEGKTWMDKDILVSKQPGGWDFKIPGIFRCNGFPVTTCDLSGGPNHGTIYVNWTDQRNGEDDTDVWLAKSTDKGDTWSEPIRVNDDGKKNQQFLTWMAVDQSDGLLYFVFYDRRGLKNNLTNVYMARSKDGGNSFENFKISEKAFYPNQGIFFGDYNNIVAQNGIVRPIWTHIEGVQLSIKTAIIDTAAIAGENNLKSNEIKEETILKEEAIEPDINVLYISFKLHEATKLSLYLYNQNGKKIKTIFKNRKFDFGKHIEQFSIPNLKLEKGSYRYEVMDKKTLIKGRTFEVL